MVRQKRSISVERRISLLEEKIKVRSVAEERMKMRAILEKGSKGQLGNQMTMGLIANERKKGKSIFQEWPKRFRFGEWTRGIFGKSLAEQLNDADISPPRVIPKSSKTKSSAQSDLGKAVAMLANLARIPEGRQAIVEHQGIPALVDVVEAGPERAKENAAATLLQLCINSHHHRALVMAEGAIPPLVALSRLGTPRAKEKVGAFPSAANVTV